MSRFGRNFAWITTDSIRSYWFSFVKLRRAENRKLNSFFDTRPTVSTTREGFPPISALLATPTGHLTHRLVYERENVLIIVFSQPFPTRHLLPLHRPDHHPVRSKYEPRARDHSPTSRFVVPPPLDQSCLSQTIAQRGSELFPSVLRCPM